MDKKTIYSQTNKGLDIIQFYYPNAQIGGKVHYDYSIFKGEADVIYSETNECYVLSYIETFYITPLDLIRQRELLKDYSAAVQWAVTHFNIVGIDAEQPAATTSQWEIYIRFKDSGYYNGKANTIADAVRIATGFETLVEIETLRIEAIEPESSKEAAND